jgi:hypothetical protein
MEWVRANKNEFTAQARAAVGLRILQHVQEKGAAEINPLITAMLGLDASKSEAAE